MFNNPPATSPRMDLAKMLAKRELMRNCEGEISDRGPNPGRPFQLPRGHGCGPGPSGVFDGAADGDEPDIVHVVAYTEAYHAAQPKKSSKAARSPGTSSRRCIHDFADLADDERVQQRKESLKKEARTLLDAIRRLGEAGARTIRAGDPDTLTAAVEMGLLDAPHCATIRRRKGRSSPKSSTALVLRWIPTPDDRSPKRSVSSD